MYVKDSTNYPNSQTGRPDSKRPANVAQESKTLIAFQSLFAPLLLNWIMAVIGIPSFITNGTVCNETSNVCSLS